MGKQGPNLFENLSLRHWYKYLLYVAGILLILVVVLGSQIEQNRIFSFSLWTISLCIFVWILDDMIYSAGTYYEEKDRSYGNHIPDAVIVVVWVKYIIHIIFFLIWVIIAFRSFF